MDELCAILDESETFIGVELLSSLNINEVLLDISSTLSQLLLLLFNLLLSFIIADQARLSLAELSQ